MNKAQTARVETLSALVAFLVKQREGRTHAELAERAQCSVKTVMRYLVSLHGEGLVYAKEIRQGFTTGPQPVVWCWQFYGPFSMPDNKAALDLFKKQKEAMDTHTRRFLDRYKQQRADAQGSSNAVSE